jgi:hypothetical protein
LNKKNFLDKKGLNYKIDRGILSALALLTQLGLTMAISIILWILVFFFIKRFFNLSDFLIILGAIIGVFSGFYADYRIIMHYFNKQGINE